MDSFLSLALNTAVPYIGMAVGAKTKNPKIVRGTSIILKSISGGRISNPTKLLYGQQYCKFIQVKLLKQISSCNNELSGYELV